MSKKPVNVNALVDELTDLSFFKKPANQQTGKAEPALVEEPKERNQSTEEPTKQTPMEAPKERTMKRTDERLMERTKIRHTFDILADQLFSLREIALEREKLFGRRVLIGDLVQEALDTFITKERNKE